MSEWHPLIGEPESVLEHEPTAQAPAQGSLVGKPWHEDDQPPEAPQKPAGGPSRRRTVRGLVVSVLRAVAAALDDETPSGE